jgi:hypothetical protein
MLLLIYSCSMVVTVTALSLSSVSQMVRQNAGIGSINGNKSVPVKQQVQWLGTRVSSVSEREQEYDQEPNFDGEEEVLGWGGQASQELQRIRQKQTESPFKERQVWQALANLEKDSTCRIVCSYGLIVWLMNYGSV